MNSGRNKKEKPLKLQVSFPCSASIQTLLIHPPESFSVTQTKTGPEILQEIQNKQRLLFCVQFVMVIAIQLPFWSFFKVPNCYKYACGDVTSTPYVQSYFEWAVMSLNLL